MSEPDFTVSAQRLAASRVAVLGLGLMGGSLALALQGRCQAIWGYDPDPGARSLARQLGAVERVFADPAKMLPEADLVVLAAPVRAILKWIEQLPALHPGSPVVLDIGSTKVQICQALESLPARFEPVGGHPMCGKETSGIAYAEKSLFQDASFFFIRLTNSTDRACSLAVQLAAALASEPIWIEADSHDRWTAATSHVPYLVASALSAATPAQAALLVGPGFRGTTRLAGSSPAMMLDILSTNRDPILMSLQRVREQVDHLEALLAEPDETALAAWMVQAQAGHRQLTAQ